MDALIKGAQFHHIEIPCDDLELAEQFYVRALGARVYLRRDADRRPNVPTTGTITEAEQSGFQIDGTFLMIGPSFRIGFISGRQGHHRKEVDHLAFAIDEQDLGALARRLAQYNVEVIEHNASRMLVQDPFGMTLELWPKVVLERMGLLSADTLEGHDSSK